MVKVKVTCTKGHHLPNYEAHVLQQKIDELIDWISTNQVKNERVSE